MSTVRIRQLCPGDLPEADAVLKRAFGVSESFRASLDRHVAIQPDGWLVAQSHDEVIGIVGAVRFGTVAYVGMMGVDPMVQGRGIGWLLMETLLADLERHGSRTLLLDATTSGEPLYRRLGFVNDGITFDMRRTVQGAVAVVGDTIAVERIGALDLEAFGADRRAALEELAREPGTQSFVDGSDGYVIAQPKVIGPLVARTPQIAERLLTWALPSPGHRMMIPAENAAGLDLARRYGFDVQRGVQHMRCGPPIERDRTLIYGQASFALG